MTDTVDRLMYLIDGATDPKFFQDPEDDDPEGQEKILAVLRQIGCALGALAILRLREDESMYGSWNRY